MRRPVVAVGLLSFALVVGCGEPGPTRHRVSGKATFKGEPIPYGDILFTPDDSVKNSGPQGIATIRDGQFDTSGSDGKGYGGGPAVIRITGLSGEGGTLLCEYEFKAELPRSDSTQTFDVPASAAAKAGAAPGP